MKLRPNALQSAKDIFCHSLVLVSRNVSLLCESTLSRLPSHGPPDTAYMKKFSISLPSYLKKECGCVRTSTAVSGSCVSLGRKYDSKKTMDSQFCEDHCLEQSVGGKYRIAGLFDGHGGHRCSREAGENLVASASQLMLTEIPVTKTSVGECSHLQFRSESSRTCHYCGMYITRAGMCLGDMPISL